MRSLSCGLVLLESVLALFIFSIAIIAIFKLEAVLLAQDIETRERIRAAFLANELLNLASADSTNISCYTTTGSGCTNSFAQSYMTNWLARINSSLPGSSLIPPSVTLDSNKVLTVTLYWQMPQEQIVQGKTKISHKYIATTQLGT